jgi:hypothetical protein
MNWRIGIGLAVVGGLLIGWGVMEWRLGRGASSTPERISLKQLIARGPEGNPNIILTDFVLCDNFVVEEENHRWKGVYVPVVPADEANRGAGPLRPTNNIKAILFSLNVHNEGEVNGVLGKRELPALVTNRIRSLGSEEKKLLQQTYGGIDANTCLIIQEGRTPFSGTLLALMFGGGAILLLGGLGLVGFGIMSGRQATTGSKKKLKRRREEDQDEDDEDDERPRKRRRDDEEDEDDEPRPKRRRPRDEP